MSDQAEPRKTVTHPTPEQVSYDLDQALSAVVSVRSRIPEDAMTAPLLGTDREGHGVLISDEGLVLTIGYLITEAETVWLIDAHGGLASGHVVAYDQETGFGLVQALQPLAATKLELGSSALLQRGDAVVLAGHGGRKSAVNARVIAKQEFAGYWEYLLDEAIFTAPAHPNWGGAALIGPDGTLRGIGSLFVQQVSPNKTAGANMIVPIDLIKPIFNDLQLYGRVNKPPRPWLGMLTTEVGEYLVVADLINNSPAQRAGIQSGDFVLEVNGEPVDELAALFRRVWSLGNAGVQVPLKLYRDGKTLDILVQSVSRNEYLKTPHIH